MPSPRNPSEASRRSPSRLGLPCFAALLALVATLALGGPALAATLQEKLDATQGKLDEVNATKGALTSKIDALGNRIDAYETQVSALRAEEHQAEVELAAKQAELDQAEEDVKVAHRKLVVVGQRLKRSLEVLRQRLVAMYQAGVPDISSVVFSADDFGDLVERSEYLKHIQDSDEQIISRVRELRNETKATVIKLKRAKEVIESARDEIAAKEAQLATAREAVESQQDELVAARRSRQAVLDQVDEKAEHLEDIEAGLSQKIQEQIMAASGVPVLPAGAMSAPSAAGLIWPVDGILTSGFGARSSPGGIGSTFHEGIDISVPEGTPIRAAAAGTVIMASYNGGYGNYTCLDHGGGLSTCYGHQSGFAVSSGQSVGQGDIIGYSGNTGASTGPHLHFEVRINGAAVDPMGYL